jgi:hypothetical protein
MAGVSFKLEVMNVSRDRPRKRHALGFNFFEGRDNESTHRGLAPVDLFGKYDLPELALFFQPPNVKRLPLAFRLTSQWKLL